MDTSINAHSQPSNNPFDSSLTSSLRDNSSSSSINPFTNPPRLNTGEHVNISYNPEDNCAIDNNQANNSIHSHSYSKNDKLYKFNQVQLEFDNLKLNQCLTPHEFSNSKKFSACVGELMSDIELMRKKTKKKQLVYFRARNSQLSSGLSIELMLETISSCVVQTTIAKSVLEVNTAQNSFISSMGLAKIIQTISELFSQGVSRSDYQHKQSPDVALTVDGVCNFLQRKVKSAQTRLDKLLANERILYWLTNNKQEDDSKPKFNDNRISFISLTDNSFDDDFSAGPMTIAPTFSENFEGLQNINSQNDPLNSENSFMNSVSNITFAFPKSGFNQSNSPFVPRLSQSFTFPLQSSKTDHFNFRGHKLQRQPSLPDDFELNNETKPIRKYSTPTILPSQEMSISEDKNLSILQIFNTKDDNNEENHFVALRDKRKAFRKYGSSGLFSNLTADLDKNLQDSYHLPQQESSFLGKVLGKDRFYPESASQDRESPNLKSSMKKANRSFKSDHIIFANPICSTDLDDVIEATFLEEARIELAGLNNLNANQIIQEEEQNDVNESFYPTATHIEAAESGTALMLELNKHNEALETRWKEFQIAFQADQFTTKPRLREMKIYLFRMKNQLTLTCNALESLFKKDLQSNVDFHFKEHITEIFSIVDQLTNFASKKGMLEQELNDNNFFNLCTKYVAFLKKKSQRLKRNSVDSCFEERSNCSQDVISDKHLDGSKSDLNHQDLVNHIESFLNQPSQSKKWPWYREDFHQFSLKQSENFRLANELKSKCNVMLNEQKSCTRVQLFSIMMLLIAFLLLVLLYLTTEDISKSYSIFYNNMQSLL